MKTGQEVRLGLVEGDACSKFAWGMVLVDEIFDCNGDQNSEHLDNKICTLLTATSIHPLVRMTQ